jgi:argininosuccinate lyase
MRDLPLIDDALETTEGMLELLTGIVSTLVVHQERMRKALDGSWCTASGKTIAVDEPTIRNALNPEVFVRTRVTVGSVAPAEVDRMLEVASTNLADSGAWLAAERARLARAAIKLDAAVHAIISA